MKIYTIQWNHVSSPANCEPEEYELNDVPSVYTSLEKAKEVHRIDRKMRKSK